MYLFDMQQAEERFSDERYSAV